MNFFLAACLYQTVRSGGQKYGVGGKNPLRNENKTGCFGWLLFTCVNPCLTSEQVCE
jgi:hypothetical protein